MPNYKVVDADKLDADLKYVADKIRAKGGTTDEMDFPLGYGDVVDAIQSGGGSSGENKLAKVVSDTEEYEITASDLEGATQIKIYAFYNCKGLTSITIPDSVKSIGANAFNSCTNLVSINIPNGVQKIDSSTFYACQSLTSIIIPDSVTYIGSSSFYRCTGLTSITIPNSVKSIVSSAFGSCYGLKNIIVGKGVTVLEQGVFNGCEGAEEIIVLGDITTVSAQVFYNARKAKYYDFTACTSVPTLSNKNAFTNIPSTCEIRVPMALVDAWKAATNWSTYASQIVGVDTGDTRPIKTFTISGVPTSGHYEEYGFSSTFEFREGMTWGEWRNSIYNKDNYWSFTNQWGYYNAICHDYYDSDNHAVVDANGNLLADEDVILEGSGNYKVLFYFEYYGEEEEEPEPTDNIEFFIQSANAHRFDVPAGTKWIDVPSIIGTSIFKIEEDILWFCEDDSWYEVVDVPFGSFHNEIIDGEMYYTSNY